MSSHPQTALSTAAFDDGPQARLWICRLENLYGLILRYATHCIMKISARNKITGTVASVEKGAVASVVKVEVKEPFKLKKGDKVSVIVKSTEVIIAKD